MGKSKRVCLIVPDNGGTLSQFPTGIAYLASALLNADIDVHILDMAVDHHSDERLINAILERSFDVIGTGCCGGYYQYAQMKRISDIVNSNRHRSNYRYVIGGHLVSPDKQFFKERMSADAVFHGEAETSLVEYVQSDFASGIPGVLDDNGYVPRIEQSEVNSISMPCYSMFNTSAYKLYPYPNKRPTQFAMPVLSGRGCTHACKFCYRMTPGWRARDPKDIVDEIEYLRANYNVTYINFSDELLAGSRARITEVCEEFLRYRHEFNWMCNARVNLCKPDLLALMKRAGCVFANLGCESMSDKVLEDLGKKQTSAQVRAAVKNCLSAGISPGLNFIWGGSQYDNEETLQQTVDFLIEHDDGSQCRTIRPCTAYPGTALFDIAKERGLVNSVEHFYEKLHTNSDLIAVNMMPDITVDEAHGMLFRANMRLLDNYRARWYSKNKEQLRSLYVGKDASFRGFRHG